MNNARNFLRKSLLISLFLVPLFLAGSYAGYTQGNDRGVPPSDQSGQRKEPKAPPKPAIDACVGKKSGDACQCHGPRGDEAGICEYTPDKKYFACRPNNMRLPNKETGYDPERSTTK